MSGVTLQSCGSCGRVWQFRRGGCPHCGSMAVCEVTASGTGTVWSVTQD